MEIAKSKRQNFVVQTWNYLPPAAKFGVVAVAGFGAYRLIKNIHDDAKDKQQKKELDKLSAEFNKPFIVTTGANQGTVIHLDLGKTANRLHDALNTGVFGWFTDVDAVKQNLFSVPKPYMSSLEYIYKKVYNQDLESVVKKALGPSILSKDDYAQIQYLFM